MVDPKEIVNLKILDLQWRSLCTIQFLFSTRDEAQNVSDDYPEVPHLGGVSMPSDPDNDSLSMNMCMSHALMIS